MDSHQNSVGAQLRHSSPCKYFLNEADHAPSEVKVNTKQKLHRTNSEL